MANKFGTALKESKKLIDIESSVVTNTVSVLSDPYAQANLNETNSRGVTVRIPIEVYRRLRDYKDEHRNESIKSLVLKSIVEWTEKHCDVTTKH